MIAKSQVQIHQEFQRYEILLILPSHVRLQWAFLSLYRKDRSQMVRHLLSILDVAFFWIRNFRYNPSLFVNDKKDNFKKMEDFSSTFLRVSIRIYISCWIKLWILYFVQKSQFQLMGAFLEVLMISLMAFINYYYNLFYRKWFYFITILYNYYIHSNLFKNMKY